MYDYLRLNVFHYYHASILIMEPTCAKLIIKAVVEVMDVHGCVGLVHSCDQHSAKKSKYSDNAKPINAQV